MEISHLLHFLDNRRRPLAKVIPSLEALRADPDSVLQFESITIPSAPLLGWSLLCGFWVAIPLSWCLFPPFWIIVDKQPKDTHQPAVSLFLGLIYLIATAVANHRLARRQIVLERQGVEFHRKGLQLFFPWAVFRVPLPGASSHEGHIRLDIDHALLSKIELRQAGVVLAAGSDARTADAFVERDQLVIADLFKADGCQIGNLIYEIAQKMAPLRL